MALLEKFKTLRGLYAKLMYKSDEKNKLLSVCKHSVCFLVSFSSFIVLLGDFVQPRTRTWFSLYTVAQVLFNLASKEAGDPSQLFDRERQGPRTPLFYMKD